MAPVSPADTHRRTETQTDAGMTSANPSRMEESVVATACVRPSSVRYGRELDTAPEISLCGTDVPLMDG